MSKRYPPIFNVILFAVAVIFMLLNPIANMIPWLPEAIKTAVTVAIYAFSALTISLIVTNIIVPNFYQFNILQFWGNYPSDATVIFVELLASTFLALLIIASVAAIGVIYGIPNMANTENRAIQLAD